MGLTSRPRLLLTRDHENFRSDKPGRSPSAAGRTCCRGTHCRTEAEVAALRRALGQTGLSADRITGLDASELAHERAEHAADRDTAQSATAAARALHGRKIEAGRADLAVSQTANKALRRANAALAESRAALRENEERLHLILDSAIGYAIFTTDLDRRVVSWNAGATRVLGWIEQEIMGRSADVIFTPEDRAAGVPEREATTALGEGRAENERWHLRRDGTRFWASGLSMPLRDPAAGPDAPPLGLLTVMRDQTERRRAEERRTLLANELNHRVKNTLVVVQSITSLASSAVGRPTCRPSPRPSRGASLRWPVRATTCSPVRTGPCAPLDGIVRASLAPLMADGSRVDLSAFEAPGMVLPPGAALTLAMAIHELATNAVPGTAPCPWREGACPAGLCRRGG